MSAVLQLHRTSLRSPVRLGTIIATTTINNHDTATPFNNTGNALKGKRLLLQPDTACWVEFGTTNAVTASISATSASFYMAAGESKEVLMDAETGHGWIACVAVSGTTNLKVWELRQE